VGETGRETDPIPWSPDVNSLFGDDEIPCYRAGISAVTPRKFNKDKALRAPSRSRLFVLSR